MWYKFYKIILSTNESKEEFDQISSTFCTHSRGKKNYLIEQQRCGDHEKKIH